MEKPKFSVAHKDPSLLALMEKRDHKTLAIWAGDCVQRILPHFAEKYPDDPRPQQALDALQAWIETGVFKMAVIRQAALAAHAAAREIGQDDAARSAARAAGQAVATAHVASHALAAANYALQAVHRAGSAADAAPEVAKERDWQIQHLLELGEN